MLKLLWHLINEESNNKINFLDGYRGTLALWVLVGHTSLLINGPGMDPFGHHIGVNGFFILSSFLLTYRLLDELITKSFNFRSTLLVIVKYFIRRFFRIYVPFVITVTLIKRDAFYGGNFSYPSSWHDLVYLKYPSGNHLWTIAPEIKYYAVIPVFCLTFASAEKTKQYWKKFLIIFFFLFSFFCFVNYYLVKTNDGFRFFCGVFLIGSLLAVIFYKTKQNEMISNQVLKNQYFQLTTGFVAMIMYVHSVYVSSPKYYPKLTYFEYTPSIWLGSTLFVMLIGAPNFFTNIFETTILRTAGKFSFGIYLYHPMCIAMLKKYQLSKLKYEAEIYLYSIGFSFCAGALFFYFVENIMIKLANLLCKYLSSLGIFNSAVKSQDLIVQN